MTTAEISPDEELTVGFPDYDDGLSKEAQECLVQNYVKMLETASTSQAAERWRPRL